MFSSRLSLLRCQKDQRTSDTTQDLTSVRKLLGHALFLLCPQSDAHFKLVHAYTVSCMHTPVVLVALWFWVWGEIAWNTLVEHYVPCSSWKHVFFMQSRSMMLTWSILTATGWILEWLWDQEIHSSFLAVTPTERRAYLHVPWHKSWLESVMNMDCMLSQNDQLNWFGGFPEWDPHCGWFISLYHGKSMNITI